MIDLFHLLLLHTHTHIVSRDCSYPRRLSHLMTRTVFFIFALAAGNSLMLAIKLSVFNFCPPNRHEKKIIVSTATHHHDVIRASVHRSKMPGNSNLPAKEMESTGVSLDPQRTRPKSSPLPRARCSVPAGRPWPGFGSPPPESGGTQPGARHRWRQSRMSEAEAMRREGGEGGVRTNAAPRIPSDDTDEK